MQKKENSKVVVNIVRKKLIKMGAKISTQKITLRSKDGCGCIIITEEAKTES